MDSLSFASGFLEVIKKPQFAYFSHFGLVSETFSQDHIESHFRIHQELLLLLLFLMDDLRHQYHL